MVQLDYVEQTGHGVPLIVSRYGREVFDITENFITVTIPLNRRKRTVHSIQGGELSFDAYDRKILCLMEENAGIKVEEISRQVGLGTTAVTNRIRRLKAGGKIERTGSRRKGRWIVLEKRIAGKRSGKTP